MTYHEVSLTISFWFYWSFSKEIIVLVIYLQKKSASGGLLRHEIAVKIVMIFNLIECISNFEGLNQVHHFQSSILMTLLMDWIIFRNKEIFSCIFFLLSKSIQVQYFHILPDEDGKMFIIHNLVMSLPAAGSCAIIVFGWLFTVTVLPMSNTVTSEREPKRTCFRFLKLVDTSWNRN